MDSGHCPALSHPTDLAARLEAYTRLVDDGLREGDHLIALGKMDGDAVREPLRLEYVRCGKASCHCAHDACHGPYWYAYSRKAGRVTSAYLGKDARKCTRG